MAQSPPQDEAELLEFIKQSLVNGKHNHVELMVSLDHLGEAYHEGFHDACASHLTIIDQKEQGIID